MTSNMRKTIMVVAATAVLGVPVFADQLPSIVDKGLQGLKAVTITEEEERQIGGDVSAMLRQRYGVAQDAAVHKYVTLVGTTLAQKSSRPNLKWTFIGRRECIRGAWRIHSHYAWRARAHSERSRAGRRAWP